MYEVNEPVLEEDWDYWVQAWWTWVLSIKKDVNPANDVTGQYADSSNNGKVYFLAGTLEGTAIRNVRIPDDRPVLIPLVNEEESVAEKQNYLPWQSNGNKYELTMEDAQPQQDKMIAAAIDDINGMISLEATFDKGTKNQLVLRTGKLCKNRVPTDVFEVDFPKDNIFDAKPGKSKIVSDGYWLFLRPLKNGPLSEGKHTLHFSGLEDDYSNELTYIINDDSALKAMGK
jgi:hypothetical protein